MKHSIFGLIALITLGITFSACQKRATDNTNGLNGFGGFGCMPGQIMSNGQCIPQGACPPGSGWNGASCVPGTPVPPTGYYPGQPVSYAASLTITNRGVFEDALARFGLCDYPGYFSFTFFGDDPYDCDTYSDRGFLNIQIYPSTPSYYSPTSGQPSAYATLGAGAANPTGAYYGGMYGGDYYVTLPLNMQVYPINNSTGFELIMVGDYYGSSSTLSFRAEVGNVSTDQTINVDVYHNGQVFARAVLNRQYNGLFY